MLKGDRIAFRNGPPSLLRVRKGLACGPMQRWNEIHALACLN